MFYHSFVRKEWGITFVFQRGVFTTFSVEDKFPLNILPEYFPYDFEMKETSKIRRHKKINFDCDTNKWNVPEGISLLPINEKYNITNTNKLLKSIEGGRIRYR